MKGWTFEQHLAYWSPKVLREYDEWYKSEYGREPEKIVCYDESSPMPDVETIRRLIVYFEKESV